MLVNDLIDGQNFAIDCDHPVEIGDPEAMMECQ